MFKYISIPNVDDILAMEAWIEEAKTPLEVEQRIAEVNKKLFEGLDDGAVEQVVRVVEQAKIRKEVLGAVAKANPAPVLVPEVAAKKLAKEEPPGGFYSPARRGYMRSTLEEGLGDEMKAMRAEATGTPFFDSDEWEEEAHKTAQETILEMMRAQVKRRQLEGKVSRGGKNDDS